MNRNALLAERIKSATEVFKLLSAAALSGVALGHENTKLLNRVIMFLADQYEGYNSYPDP